VDGLLFLERVEALAPSIIIPGHGKPLHDLTLLRAHIQAMRIMLAAGADARTRGLDADQAKDEVLPKLRALMVTMTGDDATLNSQVSNVPRRLVHAPGVRGAERPVVGRDLADPGQVTAGRAPRACDPKPSI
jgi:hypothetical protein